MLLLCPTFGCVLPCHTALILLLLHRFVAIFILLLPFFFWTCFVTCFILHVDNTHLNITFLDELLGGHEDVFPKGLCNF